MDVPYIETLANWAQVVTLPLVVIGVLIAIITLLKVQAQVREMVSAQREQNGPLLSLSFWEEPYKEEGEA